MARKPYLFDTGFITLCLTNNLPEKWKRPWNDIRRGLGTSYILEPVISESYYQLLRKGISKDQVENLIVRLKGVKGVNVIDIDNKIAFLSGYYRWRFKMLSLSLVDCFLLAVGFKNKAKIYTTDEKLKIAAKKLNISCDYLPIR